MIGLIKPRQYGKYPVRTCLTVHVCPLCGIGIYRGDKYRDGGSGHRVHLNCAEESDREWYPSKDQK
jgi:hypothetical protein